MDQTDKLSAFYESILREIKKLISQKQFDEALERIEEELNCSYLPLNYEEKLNELVKIVRIHQYEDCSKLIARLPVGELIKHVLSDPVKNYDSFVFLIDKHGEKITKSQWTKILTIFSDDQINNGIKFLFLLPLLELTSLQQQQFTYYNNSTKQQANLVISKELFEPYDDFTSDAFEIIGDVFFKEPSKLNLAESLIDLLTTYFFPEFIPYEAKLLGEQIIRYVNNSFGPDNQNNQSVDPAALKLINLVLQSADPQPLPS